MGAGQLTNYYSVVNYYSVGNCYQSIYQSFYKPREQSSYSPKGYHLSSKRKQPTKQKRRKSPHLPEAMLPRSNPSLRPFNSHHALPPRSPTKPATLPPNQLPSYLIHRVHRTKPSSSHHVTSRTPNTPNTPITVPAQHHEATSKKQQA